MIATFYLYIHILYNIRDKKNKQTRDSGNTEHYPNFDNLAFTCFLLKNQKKIMVATLSISKAIAETFISLGVTCLVSVFVLKCLGNSKYFGFKYNYFHTVLYYCNICLRLWA